MGIVRIAIFTLAGGTAGFVLGATAASVAAAVLRMSRMEGGVGAFAAGIGLLSGLLGMVVTLLAMLHSRGVTGAALVRGTLASLAGVAALAAVAHWCYGHSQDRFTKKYGSVQLQFELRPRAGERMTGDLPAAEVREDDANVQAAWDTESQSQSPGDSVLSGNARLYRLTSKRELIVRAPGQPTRIFALTIPRDPSGASAGWSPWSNPATGANWSIRYRVIQ